MTSRFFKPLSEYLKSSQKEWADEPELARQNEFEIGQEYMQEGEFDLAIPHLKKATASKKCRKDAYYALAECYTRVGMIPLARRSYERLLRLDFNYRDVQQKIRDLDVSGKAARQSTSALDRSTQQSAQPGKVTQSIPPQDRFEMLDTLHESDVSRIYRVKDTLLGRIIALKQINREYPDRHAYLQQLKERTALAHPNILRIYDIDESKGQIAMEYVEGRDLRSIVRMKGALTPKMAIYIATQLINGLHQAHQRGIIHHALTPEHILLTRQCALKIIAFRAPDSFMRLQRSDSPYKYLYIPPELFRQEALTVASNIYSFGVILYEMFTGKPPFRLRQIQDFVNRGAALEYDTSLFPNGLEVIFERCLAMIPGLRYPDIRAVGTALLAWFKQYEHQETHEKDISAYKDYLLMAWADGKITPKEAEFLKHKRQELRITEAEAHQAESDIKQELDLLLKQGASHEGHDAAS